MGHDIETTAQVTTECSGWCAKLGGKSQGNELILHHGTRESGSRIMNLTDKLTVS